MSHKVIEIVTERIRNAMKAGVKPWRKEWESNGSTPRGLSMQPSNLKTQTRYAGINLMTLFCTQLENQYPTSLWLSGKQAKDLGGNIRKGEKGTPVLWCSPITKCAECHENLKKDQEQCPKCRADVYTGSTWRFYTVFNHAQTEGIELPETQAPPELSEFQRIQQAEAFLKKSGARIGHGGDRAYYSPSLDSIQLPWPTQFTSEPAYYATALHELGHWTGHESRMARDFTGSKGASAYAFEELVAELIAAFTSAILGVDSDIENHASYLDHWVKIVEEKPSALIEACSKASKAVDYLMELTGHQTAVGEAAEKNPGAAPAQPVTISAPDKTSLKKKHGVPADARQELLDQLALHYLTASEATEQNIITLQYGSATYNIIHSKPQLERLMKALGFTKQLRELSA